MVKVSRAILHSANREALCGSWNAVWLLSLWNVFWLTRLKGRLQTILPKITNVNVTLRGGGEGIRAMTLPLVETYHASMARNVQITLVGILVGSNESFLYNRSLQ